MQWRENYGFMNISEPEQALQLTVFVATRISTFTKFDFGVLPDCLAFLASPASACNIIKNVIKLIFIMWLLSSG